MTARNVRDVMTRDVVSFDPDTTLHKVAEALVSARISGAPVVGPNGHVIGVVSETDLVGGYQDDRRRQSLLHALRLRFAEAPRQAEPLTGADVMTTPAVTISSAASVHTAAALMVSRHVDRLPVVDDGVLVGIVTRSDIIRALLRPDGDIRQEALRNIRHLIDDPEAVTVHVREGVVELEGSVDHWSDARAIEDATREIEGVLGWTSRLTWRHDDRSDPEVKLDPLGLALPPD